MPRANNRFYDLLEVTPRTSMAGLKATYRRISATLRRKVERGDGRAAARLEEVDLAFSVLSDHHQRRLYDEYGEEMLEPGFEADDEPARPARRRPAKKASSTARARPKSAERSSQPRARPAQRRSSNRAGDMNFGGFDGSQRGRDFGFPEENETDDDEDEYTDEESFDDDEYTDEESFDDDEYTDEESIDDEPTPPPRRKRKPSRGPSAPDDMPAFEKPIEAWISFKLACKGGKGEFMLGDDLVPIEIKPGTEDGTLLDINGKQLCIKIEEDRNLKRDGLNILTTINIDEDEAQRGIETMVPTLDKPIRVRVPPGARPGGKLRIKGYGIKTRGETGDLIATIEVRRRGTKAPSTPRVTRIKLGD